MVNGGTAVQRETDELRERKRTGNGGEDMKTQRREEVTETRHPDAEANILRVQERRGRDIEQERRRGAGMEMLLEKETETRMKKWMEEETELEIMEETEEVIGTE